MHTSSNRRPAELTKQQQQTAVAALLSCRMISHLAQRESFSYVGLYPTGCSNGHRCQRQAQPADDHGGEGQHLRRGPTSGDRGRRRRGASPQKLEKNTRGQNARGGCIRSSRARLPQRGAGRNNVEQHYRRETTAVIMLVYIRVGSRCQLMISRGLRYVYIP